MDFINIISQYWSLIFFIGGGIWSISYTWSKNDTLRSEVEEIRLELDFLKKDLDQTKGNLSNGLSDIRGDIKEMNAKLDLLLKGKIKQ